MTCVSQVSKHDSMIGNDK